MHGMIIVLAVANLTATMYLLSKTEQLFKGNNEQGFRDKRMTREELIGALDFVKSERERLETENEELKTEIRRLKEDLSRWQEGEYNHCDACCSISRYEVKTLREGIEKVKAEIREKEKDPQYQHEGEDWLNGLLIAEEIIDTHLN